MFGGFGQTSQQSQQPLFGAAPAQQTPSLFGQTTSQPSTLNLFGAPSSTQSTNLFGTSTNQPTSQPTNLFGSSIAPSSQAQPLSLFGSTSQPTAVSSAAPLGLFGNTSTVPQTGTSLFGSTPASNQLGSSSTNSLFGSTTQQKPPLFGQPTNVSAAPAPLSLFGNTSTAQPSLFGSTSQSSASGNLFSITSSTQQPAPASTFVVTPSIGKNAPLEQEVQPQLLELLQKLRSKIKENFEHTSKPRFHADPGELNESMANAEHFLRTVKANSGTAFTDAKDFVGKITGDVCNCKALIEINSQKKVHPGQASEQLCQLLLKFGNNLHEKIGKLNEKVYELETPLEEYKKWKENGMESQTIGKNELLEHVYRMVEICNLTHMNALSIMNKTEQLKILYTAYLRQLHGRNVKSPFKSDESPVKSVEPFDYDPQRGMNVPNIFPSTTALLSLVGSMQKSVVGPQSTFGQQSTFGSFSQPTTNTSFFGAQRPSPFTLGSTPTSTTGTPSLGSSLFSKPLTAATSTTTSSIPSLFTSTTSTPTKPAFQLPTLNVSTPSFGSTLNSSSSGTLFSGSVNKPPSLFGTK